MADALHTGLWAVLFTDLVDSTALLARVGDEAGASIRQALEQIEVRSINRHDGILVKGTGDGVMAAFTSVVDAIEAAVDIQQRVRRRNHSSEFATDLRIGISVGEVEHDEGDLFGLTVNEAARLCAVADGGEIVISDLVRTLAGSRLHDEVSGPMDHDLKGLPAPVTTWTVRWSPVDPSSEMTLPRGIVADDRFAGRDDDLRVLSESWRDVRSGATAVVMIAGEPGIGKTSLAGHFAARANEDGARVLFGACHDGAVVPFQPFAEAIDGYLTDDPFSSLADGMDELARLVPRSLGVEVTDLPTGEREQYRLFEAVVAWLVELTEQQPVVLVLDDLHWAAAPTVAMLDHVLSARNLERLLVVGTYRDTEVERSHPLASMLAELHKRDAAVRLSLRGLTEVSIADLLEQDGYDTTDGTADRLARVLHDDTAGNPLFLREVLRELRENGSLVEKDGRLSMSRLVDDMGIPQGVRDVIGQRLERLGPDAVPVMRSAAVIGRNFSAGLVQAVSDLDEETVLDVLDRALEARLLRETDRARLQFSHALVRAVLVDEISSGRRQRLHRDVAHALQRARGPDAAAISYHLVEAADVVSPEEVIRAAMAAARQHAAGTTYDLAIAELDRAMAAVEDKAIDGAVEAACLLTRGQVLMRSGDVMAAREAIHAATTTPGATAETVVQAALAFHGPARVTAPDDRELPLYRRALDMLDDRQDPALASRLHANLALGAPSRDAAQREHVRLAMELAATTDDPLANHEAQRVRFWMSLGLDRGSTGAAEEALSIARSLRSDEHVMDDLLLCCIGYGECGDLASFRSRFEEFQNLAHRSHSPLRLGFALMVEARLALGRGDLDIAEAAIGEAIATTDDEAVVLAWALVISQLNLYRGRFDEQIATIRSWLDVGMIPAHLRPLTNAGLVIHLACAGRSDEARAMFEELTGSGLSWLGEPGDWRRIAELSMLATSCYFLGDDDVAPTISTLIEPHADRHLQSSLPLDDGPATLALGRLALTSGRLDEAVSLLDTAIERSLESDLGLRAAEAQLACGLALARRDGAGDRRRAIELLDVAKRFAEERRVVLLQSEAARLSQAL